MVGDPAVAIDERPDAGARELRLQVRLRAVDDDQVRPQRQDALGVGIEQRADARQLLHLRRELVEAADADHLRSGADREQHLGQRRHERHDAPRRLRGALAAVDGVQLAPAAAPTQADRAQRTRERERARAISLFARAAIGRTVLRSSR